MAKSKWIVPAVAMMLCAVSLIGAGYAAFTATLNDSESTTVNNNYMELSLDETATETQTLDIDWAEVITYSSNTFQKVVYSTDSTTTDIVLAFKVLMTSNVDSDSHATVDSDCTVAITSIVMKNAGGTAVPATVGTLTLDGIYTEAGAETDADSIAYNTLYNVKFTFTPAQTSGFTFSTTASESYDNTAYASSTAAFAAFVAMIPETVTFSLTATANTTAA